MASDDCISFEHFVRLLRSISRVKPRCTNSSGNTNRPPKNLELVARWFAEVRRGYIFTPPNTCKILFRLLFPEEDVRRRYNLKEAALARSLATDVFGLSTRANGAGRALMQWSDYPDTFDECKLGCLGVEVENVLLDRHSIRQGKSPSLLTIDHLLDELACLSGYSDLGASDVRHKRTRAAILRDLFFNLDPTEAKFLTQIILKDLRPVLYPLTETHTTRALLQYKSNAVHILTKWEVMKAWNSNMPRVYRARATLDEAASAVETLERTSHVPRDHEAFSPILGVPIEVPKSQKAAKLSHALNYFQNKGRGDVWAETKYDGERMQIHIDLTQPPSHQITIFSKSKRNSTFDRIGTHPIIRAALNLPALPEDYMLYPKLWHKNAMLHRPAFTSVILDAEMVCYSEAKGDIDEFWRIRSIIDSSAYGIRRSKRRNTKILFQCEESLESALEESFDESMESLQSNASDNGDRHLKLVFFDIMLLDGSGLLDQDYTARRAQLEHLINRIPGYVSLSIRERISMSGGFPAAVKVLAKVFSEHIANHQEGLVLKAADSRYNDLQLPWVKLKRDYIPGYGDTVDLVILGAGWNKDRARELRVSPETFTTFFVAALERPVLPNEMPHYAPQFQILFSVEYGMDREQLETFNLYIKTSEHRPFSNNIQGLPYVFKLPKGLDKPAFMLSRPLLAELFGAGFTKEAGMRHYTLRFPRITKVWWGNERHWTEGSHVEEFLSIARLSIGVESGEEWAHRTVDGMWGCDVDQGPKDPRRITEACNEWQEKLLKLEALNAGGGLTDASTQNATFSAKRKTTHPSVAQPTVKRQKLQTDRAPEQPLRTLGSMTNVIRPNDIAQTQQESVKNLHSRQKTRSILKNDHNAQRYDKDSRQTSLQVDATSPQPKPYVTPCDVTPIPSSYPSAEQFPKCASKKSPLVQPQGSSQVSLAVPHRGPFYKDKYLAAGRTSGLASFPNTHWPQKWIHTPIVQFLQDAYVWIPRGSDNKRSTSRPPALELVPQNRRIGVMYFLLIICGCRVPDVRRTTEGFAHVDKCIIFVQTGRDPKDQERLTWLLEALESWRQELNETGNKELFVLDLSMITYDSLETFDGDVASLAIWRSSRRLHRTQDI